MIRTQSKGSNQTIDCQQILGGVEGKVMHCRADAPKSNSTRAFLIFFSLKIEQKFHVRKLRCLVRATERKMSVWRMETSDDP